MKYQYACKHCESHGPKRDSADEAMKDARLHQRIILQNHNARIAQDADLHQPMICTERPK